MENNMIFEEKYENKDVLIALKNVSELERDSLLTLMTVSDIRRLMNKSPEEYKAWHDEISILVEHYAMMLETLELLYKNIDRMLLEDTKNFSADYDRLGETEKENATVALLNNDEFKKNCFNILERNFKNLINSDEVMVALDKTFGLSKIYKKCLDMGRKSDYIYEV